MATVYLARVPVVEDLHRNVALKLMHPHLRTEDGRWTRQVLDEARLAASIRHPNVVPVLEVGEDDHGVFLIMDYVEGDTLSGILRAARRAQAPLPLPIIARILSDGLLGLHAAHELTSPSGAPLNLVHRDFSPQNILVGIDGISRLTDFGIAKVANQVNVTVSGVVKGKVGYMSPEQALGKALDRRCDVWAAGVVAWETLASRRLYAEQEQTATLLRLVTERPERIREVRPDIPQGVDDAIASALTVEVEQRCPSALELRRRLLEAWREIGPIADPADVGEYVRTLVNARLEKRREDSESVLAAREKSASTTGRLAGASSSGFASTPISDAREAASTEPAESTTVQSSNWSKPRGAAAWRTSRIGLWAGVGLATATSIGVLIRVLSSPGASPASPIVATEGSAAESPGASVALTNAGEAPSAAPASRTVSIHANAPMSAVRIGRRDVVLATPTNALEIQLTDAERATTVDLTATAQDGRRATITLGQQQAAADMIFAASPRPMSVRPPTATPEKKKSEKKPPGLAPTPYGK